MEPPAEKPRPPYKVICISMYVENLRGLDQMIEALKARGLRRANRSALIRYALTQIDLDQVVLDNDIGKRPKKLEK